jgi:protein TonB
MRSQLIGSTVAHLSLLVALFAVPRPSMIVVPGPEVVQVALLQPSATQTFVPPAPPKRAATEVESVQPTEETGVKLTPPKPPKKKPVKTEEPAPTPPEAALPYAAMGPAGLKGQVAVDATDFEFTYYLMLVRNRIAQNWTPPAGLVTAGRPVRAVVYFRIQRSGELNDVRIEDASSVEFFDRSALRSVLISAPLPPLPLGYSGYDLGVHFGFEFASP